MTPRKVRWFVILCPLPQLAEGCFFWPSFLNGVVALGRSIWTCLAASVVLAEAGSWLWSGYYVLWWAGKNGQIKTRHNLIESIHKEKQHLRNSVRFCLARFFWTKFRLLFVATRWHSPAAIQFPSCNVQNCLHLLVLKRDIRDLGGLRGMSPGKGFYRVSVCFCLVLVVIVLLFHKRMTL